MHTEPHWVARALPLGMLGLTLLSLPVLLLRQEGLPRLRRLEQELEAIVTENTALERSIRSLQGEVIRVRDNPAALEILAHDQLGLVREDEIVFQFGPLTPSR